MGDAARARPGRGAHAAGRLERVGTGRIRGRHFARARRAFTGAAPAGSCYFGPQFPIEVHDVGTNTIVDTLPPAPAATDGTMRTIAYGAQLWCAR